MYRLIIADDENIELVGLSHFIDWQRIGFTIVGLFNDGSDVMEYLKHSEADVILTDMRMCEVSGLELADYVRSHFPDIEIVILSAYSDFEEVRGALKRKLFDYLLKPVSKDELLSVFSALKQTLDKRSSEAVNAAINQKKNNVIKYILNGDPENAETECSDFLAFVPSPLMRSVTRDLFCDVYSTLDNTMKLPPVLAINHLLSMVNEVPDNDFVPSIKKMVCELSSLVQNTSNTNIVESVIAFVDEHIAETFSIDDIAKSLFFSSSYISHEFKRLTGESLSNYIIRTRMKKAMDILSSNSDISIQKLSIMIGYHDGRYFQKAFKKYTGKSPREWRRLHYESSKKL